MNISNQLPKTTPKGFSGYKERSNTFAYIVGDGIYINITNRCTNDCVFCLRNNDDTAYESDSLWLEHEPTAGEVMQNIEKIYFNGCKEFVFCGYGEPTCRFDTLIETSSLIKEKYNLPIRLNTNGQSELINGEESTLRLKGLIDIISISLNSANEDEYDKLCRPVFGKKAYSALLNFAKNCADIIPDVRFSVIEETLSQSDIEKCIEYAKNAGVKLRIRKFISENNKNPEIN